MTKYGLISLADHLPDPVSGLTTSQSQRIHELVTQAVLAEDVGFHSFGLGEHHFSHYIMPAPELALSYMAAKTERILLGTSVSLLANLDPVRFAEQLALLDILTNGRAEVTFARGASEETLHAFGIETFEDLRPKFAESLRLVLRLLTEDSVTWSGEYRTGFEDLTIQPRPLQQPHPEIWIGGGSSEISAKLAADTGRPFMLPSLFRWPVDYLEITEFYRTNFDLAGHSHEHQVGMPTYVHVAPNSQDAKRQWRPYLEHYREFAMAIRGSGGRPVDYDSLLAGPAIAGSPAEVAERIIEINELLKLDRHLVLMDAGGMPWPLVAESIELFASDVLSLL